MRRKLGSSSKVGIQVTILGTMAAALIVPSIAQAYVINPNQSVTSLFLQNFSGVTSDPYVDANPISGQSVGSNGGSTQLLTNFDGVSGQNAVEFTDTNSNGSGGYSNLGSEFNYNVTASNDPALLNAINHVLTSVAGTTGQFIFQYDIQRMNASTYPVYTSDLADIQFSPNDGSPPINSTTYPYPSYTGRDRFPTGQPNFGSGTPYTDYTNSLTTNSLFLMDNSVFPEDSTTNRGYEFTVTSNGSGQTINLAQLNFYVRVDYGTTKPNATPESYAVTNIQIFQVATATPEPAALGLMVVGGAGILLLGKRRKMA